MKLVVNNPSPMGRRYITEGLYNQAGRRRSWDLVDIAKLRPILGVVDRHLRQLMEDPYSVGSVDSVFRAMRGLYRYAAQKGMSEFCNLAYEVAQVFDPARHKRARVSQRVVLLALLAVEQMQCLLSPGLDESGLPRTPDHIERAKAIVTGLLTVW